MTVHFADRTLAGVPLLLAARDAHGSRRPTVLWYHGLGSGKDDARAELARLAEAGLLAVGVDAVGHGARRAPDLEAIIAAPRDETFRAMLALVDATVRELPTLVQALVDEGLADPRRIALVGVSMGGYLAYRAVLHEPALRVVVALLGSPEWPDSESPHLHPARFDDVALLSVTAGRDASVPPDGARRFHAALAARHRSPERARYVELADAPHLMDGAQWATLMDETVGWLTTHLRA